MNGLFWGTDMTSAAPEPAVREGVAMTDFAVRSPGMDDGDTMLRRYVHERSGGENLSPPIALDGVPAEAQSLALLLADRDANDFVHWAVVGLPPDLHRLEEGASGRDMPPSAREFTNTHASAGYYGPNPPPGSGPHRYELVAYALDTPTLRLDEHPDARTFDRMAREHAMATAANHWMFENR